MSNYESIIVGIVSGIITAFIIHLLILMFNKIILPWYRELVYSGVEIKGGWKVSSDYGQGNSQVVAINLSQKASSINGKATIVKSSNGKVVETTMMAIVGSIKDRLFNVTLIPIEKKRVGISISLLEVVGNGNIMRGSACWYDSSAAVIKTESTEWRRI